MNNEQKPRVLIGVDLGSSEIRAAAAIVEQDGHLRILGIEHGEPKGIEHGTYTNKSSIGFELKSTINKLRNRCGLTEETGCIFTAAGSAEAGLRITEITAKALLSERGTGTVSAATLDSLVSKCRTSFGERYPNYHIYSLQPTSFTVDEQPADQPIGRRGRQISGHYSVIIGSKDEFERLDGSVESAGLAMQDTLVKIEAQAAALLTDDNKRQGCLLLDLGKQTTTAGLYCGGRLKALNVLPHGSDLITSDLLAFLQMELQMQDATPDQAERFKVKIGNAHPDDVPQDMFVRLRQAQTDRAINVHDISEAIEARQQELIRYALKPLEDQLALAADGIFLTGGGSLLPGVCECVSDLTGLPARIGSHDEWIAATADNAIFSPQYSQLVGILTFAAEYWQKHQQEKPPRIPKSIGRRISGWLGDFFEDEE